jgi:hypothetical protein
MKIGRPYRSLAKHYDALAAKMDAMVLDTVIRVPKNSSPSDRWFYERAKLNNYTIRVWRGETDLVMTRVK